ncbi:HlyD family efflux transporter periplasmic adaptor subunit [bacterium]|nr:HlyD family efflux transporter periplasmic adaptor subunit [bacterium]
MKRFAPLMPPHALHSSSACRRGRTGSTATFLLVVVVTLLIAVTAFAQFASDRVSSLLSGFFSDEPKVAYLTAEVVRGPFEHRVLERGEIESSSNVEIRCEVRSRSTSGVQILEIVPEGTWVEAGERLVRLDDAALQQDLIQQQIIVSNSQSMAIEAQAALDDAKLALTEYEEGTFLELEEQQESAVFVAKEDLRRAEEYLAYSKRLAERGYIPEAQLEADTFAVEKERKELGVTETKLKVLRDFTKEKMITKLKADIATAEARLKSRQKTLVLDELRLQEISDQIAKCIIVSPTAGEVVYANDQERRGSSGDLLIAEGRSVRERQVIIRIPDDSKMRVVANVHESRISFIQPGLTADIILDAVPDLKLTGQVVGVSEYPIPSYSVYMAHIKEYEVEIDIRTPPEGLRPGMTAQVNVLVEKQAAATQVPIPAVLERAGRFFCGVPRADGSLETREITVGSTNEDTLVVLDGLQSGELVVLNLSDEAVLAQLELPEDERANATEGDDVAPEATATAKPTQTAKRDRKVDQKRSQRT